MHPYLVNTLLQQSFRRFHSRIVFAASSQNLLMNFPAFFKTDRGDHIRVDIVGNQDRFVFQIRSLQGTFEQFVYKPSEKPNENLEKITQGNAYWEEIIGKFKNLIGPYW